MKLWVSAIRADAINDLSEHYNNVFGDDPRLAVYREQIAMTANTIASVGGALQMADLFLCRCIVLEPARCRGIRFPDQPADCSLLYART